jgi:hypothetical protein
MKVRSMRGELLDVGLYLAQNEEMIALGNAGVNARGDQIDKRGQIVKTRAEIAAEYHAKNPKAVKQVALKNLDSEVYKSPAQAVKALEEKAKKSRKITDSDQ